MTKSMTPTERAQMSAMLMKLEADAMADAAKHRTREVRGAQLDRAEAEIEASKPRDRRCVYATMRPAKQKPEKSAHPAALALARARRR